MTATASHNEKKMTAARRAARLLATAAMAFALGLPAVAQAQSNPSADTGTQNQTPTTKRQMDEQTQTKQNAQQSSGQAASPAAPAAHRSLASIRLGTDAGGRVQIGVDQKQQIQQIVRRHHVKPVETTATVRIGAAPPAAAVLTPVPADLIEVLPQFRGNRYFATADRLFIVDRNVVIAEIPIKPAATAAITTRSQTRATERTERHGSRKSVSRKVRRDVTVGLGTADDVVVDRVEEPVTVYRERIVPAPIDRRRVVVEPPGTIVLDRPGVTLERVPARRRIYLDEDD